MKKDRTLKKEPPEKESPVKEHPEAEKPASGFALVRMTREASDGGPLEADVHPGEVENWKAAGWKIK